MLNPIQSYTTFDTAEIQRRLAAIKDQAEDYLVTLHTPTPEEQSTLKAKLNHSPAEKERKEIIRDVYHCNIKVKINPVYNGGAAAVTKWYKNNSKKIYLHPLMLCNFSDFPKDLRPNAKGQLRPNEEYFKQLKSWIVEKFGLKENQLPDISRAMHFLLWYNSPILSSIKDFVIAHEVGHLHYRHIKPQWDRLLSVALTGCIGTVLVLTTPFILALLATIVSFLVSRIALRCFAYWIHKQKDNEKQADLTALKLVKTIDGAEVYFNSVQAVFENFHKPLPWHKKVRQLISQPEVFFRLTHPTPKERLVYIKKAQIDNVPLTG